MRFIRTTILYVLLALIALTTITPLAWMAIVSLHPPLAPTPTIAELIHPNASRFVAWSGDVASNNSEISLSAVADASIRATFENYSEPGRDTASPAPRSEHHRFSIEPGGFAIQVEIVGEGSVTARGIETGSVTDDRIILRAIPNRKWFFQNYSYVLTFPELPVWRFAVNTIAVTTGVVLFQLTLCSLAAFGFARLSFRGRDTLFFIFLITMMVPAQVLIVPLFVIVQNLGWLNTYLGLIVPYPYISTAFGTFLLRQAMLGIPRSLDDAGRLDGCGELRLLWHVILPSCRPALATVAALAFIWTWGDFYWPLLASSSMDMRTLEVGLSIFRDSYGGSRWPLQMTAAIIVLTPVLIVFLAMQRFFVRGVVTSGIKG